jgi:hypothetical protein
MGIEVVRQRRLAPATRWRRERRDISIDKRDAETAAEADFLRNLFRSDRVPPGREGVRGRSESGVSRYWYSAAANLALSMQFDRPHIHLACRVVSCEQVLLIRYKE